MKNLVLALVAILVWTAYGRLSNAGRGRRSFGTSRDAFPFPTAASQTCSIWTTKRQYASGAKRSSAMRRSCAPRSGIPDRSSRRSSGT